MLINNKIWIYNTKQINDNIEEIKINNIIENYIESSKKDNLCTFKDKQYIRL